MVASLVFFPDRALQPLPIEVGLQSEDAWIETQDRVRLHGWFFEAREAKHAALFLHGNGTNISGLLTHAKGWSERGISVLLVDYRSYGKSGGAIRKGTDVFLDAEAAVEWLVKEKGFTPSQIILYGQSIGSAPAIELARKESYHSLVLEAPFTSLEELAKLHYGFSYRFFLKDFPFNNLDKIAEIKCPLFIIHGTDDEVSPYSMGERLFERATVRKEFLRVPGAHHNDLLDTAAARFFDEPLEFIKALDSW